MTDLNSKRTNPTQKQIKEELINLFNSITDDLPKGQRKEQAQIWAAANPFGNLPIDKDLSIVDSKIKIELLINPVFGCYQYADEKTKAVINQVVDLHKAYVNSKGSNAAVRSVAVADTATYAVCAALYAAIADTANAALYAATAAAWNAPIVAEYARIAAGYTYAAAALGSPKDKAAWDTAKSVFYTKLSFRIIELINES